MKKNKISCIEVIYLDRASRSLEKIKVLTLKGSKKTLYIYNFEGIHFRVFDAKQSVKEFFSHRNTNCLIEFQSEVDLDNYLLDIK